MNPDASDQIKEQLETLICFLKHDIDQVGYNYRPEDRKAAVEALKAKISKTNDLIFAIENGLIYINEPIGDPWNQWDVQNKKWLNWVEYAKELGLHEWDARKYATEAMKKGEKTI
jgi:hypothetical protein